MQHASVMPHRFTAEQTLQNRKFLRALRRTGNVREVCRALGRVRNTYLNRRARCPAFAAAWDAALAMAHAHLNDRTDRIAVGKYDPGAEPRIVRARGGRLQLHRQRPDRLAREHEQAFLAALSATANVSLSAAAAGFSKNSFYKRRQASPAFAREMRLALQMGYDRLEMALLERFDPASHADDAWRRNDPPPIASMTPAQALQLMYLHQKEARLLAEPAHIKRRRGESREAHSYRLSAMYEARLERAREAFRVAEAERRARGEPWIFGPEDIAPLPALDQVTGWSKADPTKGDFSAGQFGGVAGEERGGVRAGFGPQAGRRV